MYQKVIGCAAVLLSGNQPPTALREFIQEAQRLDAKPMGYIIGNMKEPNSRKRAGNRKGKADKEVLKTS